ncbi:hypothetical protein OESDEN_12989 [Oesophagostomum dentatum]|uniref:Uncharacterized protein n=1 Tax=Oesophagostomum dentatum TaxID=61180 RepID=A0A0B1STN1_OESDE|nr:hypothetical protein OESDEN_12989 [Oesophagostomum dentatum]
MLVKLPATTAGFEYCWLPYEQASRYIDKDFAPVHMSHVAPCVIQAEDFELLGSVNLKQERAEVAFDGHVHVLDGPKIRQLQLVYSSNHEFTGDVIGSLQMLVKLPATTAGFEYCWLPYEQASRYIDKDFAPVHMSHVAPCVIQAEDFELLGSVNLKQERAEVAFDGHVHVLDGPKIRQLQVLCRKDRDDTMVI